MSNSITISSDGSTITIADESAHSSLTGRSDADQHPQSAITGLVTALAAKQPLDADLTAIAALTTTAYGRGVLPLADAPALASYAGLPLLATSGITGTLTLTKAGTTARTATFPDAAITVAGSASALTSGLIPQAGTGGILADSALGTSSITGTLTLTKTGTTARTVTFPDAAITVARIDAAQTFTGQSTFTDGIITTHADAATSAGVHIGNATHQDVAIFGAGGGQGTTLYGQLNGTALSMSGQFSSTLATGTAPISVASTTVCPNLNAALLNGATFADPGAIGGTTPGSGAFTTISASGAITSTLPTGSAPFVVASTTNVANLNASSLNGATFAAPGSIGSGTPAAGAFTTLSATGQITSTLATGSAPLVIASTTKVANLNVDLLNGTTWAAPGAIGGATPGSGSFTTLTASSTAFISGSGAFGASALLASERLRVAGGTMGTPGATDVLAANGQIYCGNTGFASIECAGGIKAVTQVNVGGASSDTIGGGAGLQLRKSDNTIGTVIQQGTASTDFWTYDGSTWLKAIQLNVTGGRYVNFPASGATGTPGATEVRIGAGKVYAGDTSATSIQTAGGITAAGNIYVNGGLISIGNKNTLNVYSGTTAAFGGISASGWTNAEIWTNTAGGVATARLTVDNVGKVSVLATTASISTTTGALTVAGGLGVAGAGNFGAGVTCTTLTASAAVNLAAVAASTTAGDIVRETGQDKNYAFSNGIGGWLDKCIYSQYASVTQSGAVTAQSLASATARGTRTLPANFFKAGKVLKFRLCGVYTTDAAAGNATIAVKIGGTTIRTTASFALDASITNGYWLLDGEFTCLTTGATGTVDGQLAWIHAQLTPPDGSPPHAEPMTTTAAVTVDTTASGAFDVVWTANDAGTSITCTCFRLWEVC